MKSPLFCVIGVLFMSIIHFTKGWQEAENAS